MRTTFDRTFRRASQKAGVVLIVPACALMCFLLLFGDTSTPEGMEVVEAQEAQAAAAEEAQQQDEAQEEQTLETVELTEPPPTAPEPPSAATEAPEAPVGLAEREQAPEPSGAYGIGELLAAQDTAENVVEFWSEQVGARGLTTQEALDREREGLPEIVFRYTERGEAALAQIEQIRKCWGELDVISAPGGLTDESYGKVLVLSLAPLSTRVTFMLPNLNAFDTRYYKERGRLACLAGLKAEIARRYRKDTLPAWRSYLPIRSSAYILHKARLVTERFVTQQRNTGTESQTGRVTRVVGTYYHTRKGASVYCPWIVTRLCVGRGNAAGRTVDVSRLDPEWTLVRGG